MSNGSLSDLPDRGDLGGNRVVPDGGGGDQGSEQVGAPVEQHAVPTPDEAVDLRKLAWAVADDIWEHFSLDDPGAEWFIENIEEPVKALICQIEGHYVVDDMCGFAHHRFCAKCGKPMPNVALSE